MHGVEQNQLASALGKANSERIQRIKRTHTRRREGRSVKALRSHQFRWSVTVTRKYNPPRQIVVFGRSAAEALQGAVSSAREVWGIWDAKSFSTPERK